MKKNLVKKNVVKVNGKKERKEKTYYGYNMKDIMNIMRLEESKTLEYYK